MNDTKIRKNCSGGCYSIRGSETECKRFRKIIKSHNHAGEVAADAVEQMFGIWRCALAITRVVDSKSSPILHARRANYGIYSNYRNSIDMITIIILHFYAMFMETLYSNMEAKPQNKTELK